MWLRLSLFLLFFVEFLVVANLWGWLLWIYFFFKILSFCLWTIISSFKVSSKSLLVAMVFCFFAASPKLSPKRLAPPLDVRFHFVRSVFLLYSSTCLYISSMMTTWFVVSISYFDSEWHIRGFQGTPGTRGLLHFILICFLFTVVRSLLHFTD